MDQFKNIGLMGRQDSEQVVETLLQLIEFLESNHCHVILESDTANLLPHVPGQTASKNVLGEACDLVIVVGGDGCLLGAGRALCKYKVPILGVNRGRLGFLTDILPSEVTAQVGEVLAGKYHSEERFLLEAQVVRDREPVGEGDALNDVVFHASKSVKMVEFDLYIDGHFVYRQRSDGLIVSTPTGSTAYALSGGGPIMHPKLDAVVIVPMFPHTLSSRPIVVDGKSEIKVVFCESNETSLHVSMDAQGEIVSMPGDVLYIRKKSQRLTLLHPLNYSFYKSCRSKLGWGSKW